jgi:hypothetical protein
MLITKSKKSATTLLEHHENLRSTSVSTAAYPDKRWNITVASYIKNIDRLATYYKCADKHSRPRTGRSTL